MQSLRVMCLRKKNTANEHNKTTQQRNAQKNGPNKKVRCVAHNKKKGGTKKRSHFGSSACLLKASVSETEASISKKGRLFRRLFFTNRSRVYDIDATRLFLDAVRLNQTQRV